MSTCHTTATTGPSWRPHRHAQGCPSTVSGPPGRNQGSNYYSDFAGLFHDTYSPPRSCRTTSLSQHRASGSTPQPDVPEPDAAGAVLFDLQPDRSCAPEERRILVDENRHHPAIDDVSDLVAARDDVQLVPVVDLEGRHQRVRVAERSDEARPCTRRGADNASAPGDFTAFRSPVLDVASHQPVVVV